ncbi:hypothetical protein IQ230_23500 [Gloeocapsopsis crepidinum LEGE 06123]|uniref:Uncharacterized protein n=1 Tax=Gloeocapsopsis crepidinum LEGE 06123 TaxID=588587 RepID=A0ABR9UY93_9CHRO|nr:hypothetical protein [Gloeocapsopsis crepidinum]MBE9193256.1 hypothetical protein [Gloeocapsopsis crepidinum LEGE 06123]
MPNIKALDKDNSEIEIAADGDGSAANPFITYHKVVNLPASMATNEAVQAVKDRLPIVATNSNVTTVAATNSLTVLLAANQNRLGAAFYNLSPEKLYLKLGDEVSDTSFSVLLNADDYYELPFRYIGIVTGVWVAAVGNCLVTELF